MASTQRTKNPTVAEQLFTEGDRFDFYQAVRVLEQSANPQTTAMVGEDVYPEKEPVRFRANVRLAYPANDIEAIIPPFKGKTKKKEKDTQPTLWANFMGIAGVHGPLPAPYTELLMARVSNKDYTLRDFLDIFNHRAISLLYRARKHQRIGLEIRAPSESQFANYLYALMGLGTAGLQNRMHLDDRALLLYAGLFVHQPRSLSALECLLTDFFKVNVTAEPWQGQWLDLPEDEYTYIGIRKGQNQVLGQTATLGTRVWDLQSQFALHVGPVNLKQYADLLPIGLGFIWLCELTRLFIGPEFEFGISLTLKADEMPGTRLVNPIKGCRLGRKCRLGRTSRLKPLTDDPTRGSHLGWTSWLKTGPCPKDVTVTLSPQLINAIQESR
ncbi:MAG TPA: type VI secretion system baseplate subunit TssG [Thioploca sp.]|nr:MAG: type VI secretion system baseplate subunit TssG [Gammaproteobacteria bacterium]HDN27473.1 type VI secretion system baseplate subunit TssG [Thioploca sp.]